MRKCVDKAGGPVVAVSFGRGSSPRSESSESALTRPEGLVVVRYGSRRGSSLRSESSGSALPRLVGLRRA